MESTLLELSAKISTGGSEIKFSLPPTASGADVRAKISELSGFLGSQMKLLFGGKYVFTLIKPQDRELRFTTSGFQISER